MSLSVSENSLIRSRYYIFLMDVAHNLRFASLTLSGVETSKYSPFHGFCFFDDIFSFFNLMTFSVSDISQETGFNYWY